MNLYARMRAYRLIWIILIAFFVVACSRLALIEAVKQPVAANQQEKQLLQRGTKDFEQGNFEAALQQVEEVLKLNPDNIEAIYAGAASFQALGQFDKSLQFSKRAAAYRSDFLPDVYLLMGRAYEQLGEHWDALRTYRSASSVYPNDPRIHFSLAETYNYLNKPELAAESYKAAILLDPGHAVSHYHLGVLYFANDYDTPALMSLSTALLMQPFQGPAALIRDNIIDLLGRGELDTRKNDEGDFRKVGAALLEQRSSLLQKPGKEAVFEMLKAQYHILFKMLDTEEIKDQKKSVIMDNYIAFYNKLYQQGLDEVFVYFIFQGSDDPEGRDWLEKHPVKVKRLEQLVKETFSVEVG